MAIERGFRPELLYVVDDTSFYETDWRMQGILNLVPTSAPLNIGHLQLIL